MPNTYELDPGRDVLARIDGWPAGDSRRLLFTVMQDGSPKDISNDDVRWELRTTAYESAGDTVLDGDDSGVTIQRENVVDPTAGEVRIDIAEDATTGEWGQYWQTVTVDPPGDSQQSWTGEVIITG